MLRDAYAREVWPEDRLDRLVADLSRGYFINIDLLELAMSRGLLDLPKARKRMLLVMEHTERNGKMCYPLHGANRKFFRVLNELDLIDKNTAIQYLEKRFRKARRLHCDEISDLEYFGVISSRYANIFLMELYLDLWMETLSELDSAVGIKNGLRHDLKSVCLELRNFRSMVAKHSGKGHHGVLDGSASSCEAEIERAGNLIRNNSVMPRVLREQGYQPSWFWRYADANGASSGWRGRKRSFDESLAMLPVLGAGVTFPVRFMRARSGVSLTQWLYEHGLEGATSSNGLGIFREIQRREIRPVDEMQSLLNFLVWLQIEYYRDFGAVCELSLLQPGIFKPLQEIRSSPCSSLVFERVNFDQDGGRLFISHADSMTDTIYQIFSV